MVLVFVQRVSVGGYADMIFLSGLYCNRYFFCLLLVLTPTRRGFMLYALFVLDDALRMALHFDRCAGIHYFFRLLLTIFHLRLQALINRMVNNGRLYGLAAFGFAPEPLLQFKLQAVEQGQLYGQGKENE